MGKDYMPLSDVAARDAAMLESPLRPV